MLALTAILLPISLGACAAFGNGVQQAQQQEQNNSSAPASVSSLL